MTTRKELIIEKYTILKEEIKKISNEDSLFGISQDIGDDGIADLVFYVTMLFVGVDTEIQYENKIKELLEFKDISMCEKDEAQVIILVRDFVQWLKNLKCKYKFRIKIIYYLFLYENE
jgi:hypothetical protein